MTRRVLNDPDSHIMELPDFLTGYADPAIRDRLPALLPAGSLDATLVGLPDGGRRGHSPETVAQLKALGDQILRGPKWYAALGAFNSKERGSVLDALGIQRQVSLFFVRRGYAFRLRGSRGPLRRRQGIQSRDDGVRCR